MRVRREGLALWRRAFLFFCATRGAVRSDSGGYWLSLVRLGVASYSCGPLRGATIATSASAPREIGLVRQGRRSCAAPFRAWKTNRTAHWRLHACERL